MNKVGYFWLQSCRVQPGPSHRHVTIPIMESNDGGGSAPNLIDLASNVIAASTGHSARYHRTWEEELGDSTEAKSAAAAWRSWGIERPGVLLRKEWFGGAPARLFEWNSPPDSVIRERYGFTYDTLTHWVWWGFTFSEDEYIDEWLRVGLDAHTSASILSYARKTVRGGRFNARRLANTAQRIREQGLEVVASKVWALQNSNSRQIARVYDEFLGPLHLKNHRHNRWVAYFLYRKFGVWIAQFRLTR